ncbi:MAG: hypothetical protein B6D68_00210, partial [spirochete symbiont of Stewartia floridana]
GNPGSRYESTRHNVGYRVVDIMMRERQVSFQRWRFSWVYHARVPGDGETRPIIFIRWSGYMNESGGAVSFLKRKWHLVPENFYAVADNMDLPPGACRLKFSGGDAGHNGLKSLIRAFGAGTFNRIYIGVGRPEFNEEVVAHVLDRPGREGPAIEGACLKAAAAIWALRSESFARVAETLNRRE